jgi:hypothetical protein
MGMPQIPSTVKNIWSITLLRLYPRCSINAGIHGPTSVYTRNNEVRIDKIGDIVRRVASRMMTTNRVPLTTSNVFGFPTLYAISSKNMDGYKATNPPKIARAQSTKEMLSFLDLLLNGKSRKARNKAKARCLDRCIIAFGTPKQVVQR